MEPMAESEVGPIEVAAAAERSGTLTEQPMLGAAVAAAAAPPGRTSTLAFVEGHNSKATGTLRLSKDFFSRKLSIPRELR